MKVEYSGLIDIIQESKLKKVIIDALSYDDQLFKKIRKTIPNSVKIKGYTVLSKITFRNHRLLVKPILEFKLFILDDTSKLLLNGF